MKRLLLYLIDTFITAKPHDADWYVHAAKQAKYREEPEGTTPEDVAASIEYLRGQNES